jgi:hypothetical protein
MSMPSYRAAVERAAAELVRSIDDPSRGEVGPEAFFAALRVFVGDDAATAFPSVAVERVRRDVLISYGDQFTERLRRKIERRFGTHVAEVADRLIVEDVAEMIRGPHPTDESAK